MEPNDTSRARGFEYKSRTEIFGLPLIHISFKYYRRLHPFWKRGMIPVPARGIIAVGQVGFGVITNPQFGVELFTSSQFAIGAFAIAQFSVAVSALAQIGVCLCRDTGNSCSIYGIC